MKPARLTAYSSVSFFLLTLLFSMSVISAPLEKIEPKARCPVCGMFVAKYSSWITQVHHEDGDIQVFDGVKDMMAYYFTPDQFSKHSKKSIGDIWVKDYYMLSWIDAQKAFYVIGSDVYGPMGHEFIPFSTEEAAESFKKDHRGKQILSFAEITEVLVESLRSGQKMK
jgi:nitrous oxide reductase accessory protein NosL